MVTLLLFKGNLSLQSFEGCFASFAPEIAAALGAGARVVEQDRSAL